MGGEELAAVNIIRDKGRKWTAADVSQASQGQSRLPWSPHVLAAQVKFPTERPTPRGTFPGRYGVDERCGPLHSFKGGGRMKWIDDEWGVQ